jgi:hypothetical protein
MLIVVISCVLAKSREDKEGVAFLLGIWEVVEVEGGCNSSVGGLESLVVDVGGPFFFAFLDGGGPSELEFWGLWRSLKLPFRAACLVRAILDVCTVVLERGGLGVLLSEKTIRSQPCEKATVAES